MAHRTTVTLVDDLDGESEATETVSFALDGSTYEIDLTAEHAESLRGALAPFTSAARKAGRSARATRSPARTKSDGPSAEEIRRWAKSKKLKVSPRGRISADIRAAFEAAHS